MTSYSVSIDKAAKVGQSVYDDKTAGMIPAFEDFSDFYVYAKEDYTGKIARAIAAEQNVVWGTGTHTAAPVPVYAFGPEGVTKQFSTLQHHVDVANKMITALGLSE